MPSSEATASAFVHGTDPTTLYPLPTPRVVDGHPAPPVGTRLQE
jgi:hypothetical protein